MAVSSTSCPRRPLRLVAGLLAAVTFMAPACTDDTPMAERGTTSTTRDAAVDRPGRSTSTGPDAAPTTAPTTTAPKQAETFTLLFAGDLLPHGQVNQAAAAAGRSTGKRHDFAPLLAPMRPIVSAADLAVCHMEVPVARNQDRITSYPVFGAPVELVQGVADTGYDGCTTASNHSLDQHQDGVRATLDAFDAAALGHTGTARSAEEGARIRTYDVKGVPVANLSYSYDFNGFQPPAGAQWSVNKIELDRILADARRAREAGAQFVVVSVHWGNEYQLQPSAQQKELAPALTASPDIDLVVGHHAHVVQPIVRINDEYVIYGHGNQLSSMTQPPRRDGLTTKVTVTRQPDGRYAATGIEAIATWVDMPSLEVLPVAARLAEPATPPALRAALQASQARTAAAVSALGPTPGVTVAAP